MSLVGLIVERIRKNDEEYKRHCEEADRRLEEVRAHNRAVMERAKAESAERRKIWREEQSKKQKEQSPWFSALKSGHFK